MAGETINERGSWSNIQVAASVANAAFSAGARTTIAAALSTGQEANYPLLDLQLAVSVGTPAAGGLSHVYRRNKADGTNEQGEPDATNKQQYVGTFVMEATASSYYYIYGIPNDDPSATYYLENQDGVSTLTLALAARGRTYKAAS
jgi:hypothetical protein